MAFQVDGPKCVKAMNTSDIKQGFATLEQEYEKWEGLEKKDVEELRNWVKSHEDYPHNLPEIMYAVFLNVSDYDMDKAKMYLDKYLKIRSKTPGMFYNLDPLCEDIQSIFGLAEVWFSRKSNSKGNKVIFLGLHNHDPTNYDFSAAYRYLNMVVDAYVIQNGTCLGVDVVLDCRGVCLRHLLKVRLNFVKAFFSYIQEAVPLKINDIHVIHMMPIADKILLIAKPFLKRSLIDKVQYHSGQMLKFYEAVSRDILPEDLGGTDDITREDIRRETESNLVALREWFLDWQDIKIKYNENNKEASSLVDIPGLSKLEID